jgi:hypothetical protein
VKVAVEILARQQADAYDMIRNRIEGLTDDEFWWEPVPDCWTVRRSEAGTWAVDYAIPDPDPPPFTTIGWRLDHVAECKVMYHEYAFGPGRLTFPDIDSAHTARNAIELLERGQALLVEDLAGLDDADLQRTRLTNWGEEWPTWRILWTMIHHDYQHGGEIGALRDLYRLRGAG